VMKWLVQGACQHDSLFFHYSGHGGRTKDTDGDELDGWDEVIYPVDWEKSGGIVDDLMNELMVRPLPAGCRLTAVFDSCHSGSALDLPYMYTHRGMAKTANAYAMRNRGGPGDVISFSGSTDLGTSADTTQNGHATGAMSWALIKCLTAKPQQSYQSLLLNVRALLKKQHFSQVPQLGATHRMNGTYKFIM